MPLVPEGRGGGGRFNVVNDGKKSSLTSNIKLFCNILIPAKGRLQEELTGFYLRGFT